MTREKASVGGSSMVQIEAGSFRAQRPENPGDVLKMIKGNDIQIVDLKFADLPGLWQHFSIALPEVSSDLFEDGMGFDGSSIRGFQEIHEADRHRDHLLLRAGTGVLHRRLDPLRPGPAQRLLLR